MSFLDFMVDPEAWVKRRYDLADAQKKQTEQEGLIRQALAMQAFGGQPGTQGLDPLAPVPGLQGVTDTTSPLAGLQQQLGNDQLEQQRQTALPGVAQLAQSVALARAGLRPDQIQNARTEMVRGNLLADNAQALTPDARVNAANKQDVSPVRSDGGVFYDRFNRQVPFIGMSEPAAARADASWAAGRASDAAAQASNARAGLSNAQQQTANLRLQALQDALGQTGLDPLIGADIANANTVAKPQRVKVKGEAGDVYYDALPKPGGGFDYRPATGPDGKPVAVPVSESGDGGTALQRDTAFISQTLSLSPQEAIRYKLESRGKGDQALRDDIALRLMSDPGSAYMAKQDPAKFQALVDSTFRTIRPTPAAPAAAAPVIAPPDAALDVPPQQAAPAPAPTAPPDAALDVPPQQAAMAAKARARATKEGYSRLGAWVPERRAWEVRDASGRVVGYFE